MATVSKMVVNGSEYDIIDKQARTDITAEATARENADNAIKETIYDTSSVESLFTRSSFTYQGITFAWDENICTVSGSAEGSVANTLISHKRLPVWAIPGNIYRLKYKTTDIKVRFGFVFFDSEDTATYVYYTSGGYFTIPSNCAYWSLRLYVASGTTFTQSAVVSECAIEVPGKYDNIIEDDIAAIALHDLLGTDEMTINASLNGVDFVMSEKNIYKANGTLADASTALCNVFLNKTSFPSEFAPGDKCFVYVKSNVFRLRVVTYTGSSDSGTAAFDSSTIGYGEITGSFTIPSNATGMAIRFQYTNSTGNAVTFTDEPMSFHIAKHNVLCDLVSNLLDVTGNDNAKILSIGNSFLTGAVWHNNDFDHLVSYNNSIYGQIAISLNVAQSNVNHTMYSSTGMLTPTQDNGSFLDIITSTSLAGYDYLLTQFNGSDINGNALGTVDSTENDGTIAGAIVHLMNYIKTSNGLCKLILLGVPPYSADPNKSGANVFTGNWGQGYSINDLDNVMYALAKKLHFIYISWQDLEISYHYMDYADYTEGQTNPRHAKDDAVYRALGEYAALQIRPVSSPIAMGKLML